MCPKRTSSRSSRLLPVLRGTGVRGSAPVSARAWLTLPRSIHCCFRPNPMRVDFETQGRWRRRGRAIISFEKSGCIALHGRTRVARWSGQPADFLVERLSSGRSRRHGRRAGEEWSAHELVRVGVWIVGRQPGRAAPRPAPPYTERLVAVVVERWPQGRVPDLLQPRTGDLDDECDGPQSPESDRERRTPRLVA